MLLFDLFVYLKSFYDSFFYVEKLTKRQRLNIIFEKLDALYEKKPDKYLTDEDSCIAAGQLFTGQGTITHLYSDYGYINDNLYFSREMARNLQLQEGYMVLYIARKICDDIPVQIYAIKSIVQENWGFENILATTPVDNQSLKTLSTHEKWLHGVVVGVDCSNFSIETNDAKIKTLEVELSRIDCTFLPMVGDDVSVLTLCETDETSQDYSGLVIEMRRLIPTNKALYEGKIASFPMNGGYGLIDKEYIFYMDALRHSDNIEHKVNVGDRVIAEAISCSVELQNYKKFGWRCIKIVKNIEFRDKNVAAMPLTSELEFEDDQNEHSISITKSSELQVMFCDNITLGEEKKLEITIQNDSDQNHKVNGVIFKFQNAGVQVACDQFTEAHSIPSKSAFTYTVTVTSRQYGITYERIIFSFDGGFEIERCIKIDVAPGSRGTVDSVESAQKVAKHTKEYTKSLWSRNVDVQPGIRVKESPHFVFRRLKPFEVPRMLLDAVLETTSELNVSVKLAEILPSFCPLEFVNYKRCIQALLHLEEIALDHEFRKYDRSCAHFTRENTCDGQYLALSVENVMESRPSIIVGDKVYAQSLSEDSGFVEDNDNRGNEKLMLYEGFVHKIKNNRLLIKFGDNFHSRYNGEDYRIHFKFTRSQFIKQHNAIETVNDPKILFPLQVNVCDMLQLDVSMSPDDELISNYRNRVLPWYNKQLNSIQKKAIECILRGESRPMPYIIFGPPGTGKTSTVVELILQVFKRVGGSRIIVCAPSNSAANLIAKRIIDSKALMLGEFVRIVSKNSIERELIPDELLPYCAMADIATPDTTDDTLIKTKSGLLLNANSVSLAGYKLLISTASSFGSLMYMKFRRSHFTHVIIDEAGQCMESEVMIPISLLNKAKGQIVLAGDPMQLGPIVTSRLAKDRGLGKSFLVRLLDRVPYSKYSKDAYDCRTVTKLLYNYRALPSVLSSYNKLFYENELKATISEVDSEEKQLLSQVRANISKLLTFDLRRSCKAPCDANDNYGIFFCGVRGREEQVPESSSWSNPSEVYSVFYTVKGLIHDMKLKHTDIGIITPYSLQVKEIRDLLVAELDENMPKIGSVEEFQGQERNVIVISTVRSNVNNIETDTKYNMGFVKNAKRMNVAISRARAVLMVFGNPDVLMADSDWRTLILDCQSHGTYYGCDLPPGFEQIEPPTDAI